MYAIQSKPKNNIAASWNLCHEAVCDGKTCPCVFFFRGDAERELARHVGVDEGMLYRIECCELKYY